MKKVFLPLFIFLTLVQTYVWAAPGPCTGPEAGTMHMDAGKLEFCNGTAWRLIGAPSLLPNTGCGASNLKQIYNSTALTPWMEYCNTPIDTLFVTNCHNTGLACAQAGQQRYYAPDNMMQYCNGTNWVNMGSSSAGPCCPEGFIPVPADPLTGVATNFCVSKYHMKAVKKTDGVPQHDGGPTGVYFPESRADYRPWVNLDFDAAEAECQSLGANFHVITNAEWMTIAKSIENRFSNWSGNAVGNGYIPRGHSDSAPNSSLPANASDSLPCHSTGNANCAIQADPDYPQKRTLTLLNNAVIWDFAGNVNSWVDSNGGGESVSYWLNTYVCAAPCTKQLNDPFNTDEVPARRYISISAPFMYSPDPQLNKNKFGFLPANDALSVVYFGTGTAYNAVPYDQRGLGMITWRNSSIGFANDVAIYRGGFYGQANTASGEKPGGIYSAWVSRARGNDDINTGFRCVYVPSY